MELDVEPDAELGVTCVELDALDDVETRRDLPSLINFVTGSRMTESEKGAEWTEL